MPDDMFSVLEVGEARVAQPPSAVLHSSDPPPDHLQHILQFSQDGIALLDFDGIIRSWSCGAERIFGYTAGELIGQHCQCLLPPHLIESGELDLISRKISECGEINAHRTLRVAKNGQPVSVDLCCAVLRDASGAICGRTEVYRDLTPVHRLDRQMRKTQRLVTVAQLLAGLAHEIGTPLNVIAGRAELLLLGMQEEHPHRKDLEVIERESQRVAEMISTLLQFARGSQQAQLCRCSLNEIVQEVLCLLGPQLRVASIKVQTDLAERLPSITANRTQLIEIVLNLVFNAIHAMPAGGKLHLQTTRKEHAVELHVTDSGKGIPSEIHGKIFEPFFSTKAPGQGTGLGLTVVESLVKQHDGTITFFSEVGEGTTFTVKLPIRGGKIEK